MRLNKEPIATRLGKLAAEARTGILDVTGDTRGTIHIHGGRVVYAESARTPGLTARLAGWAPGQNLPGSLERAWMIREATADAALDLFSFAARPRYGRRRQGETLVTGDDDGMPVTALLAEVARRQEIMRQMSALVTADTAVQRQLDVPSRGVRVSAAQWALVIRVNGPATPRDLAMELGHSVFGTTIKVLRLMELNLLSTVGGPADGSDRAGEFPGRGKVTVSFIRAAASYLSDLGSSDDQAGHEDAVHRGTRVRGAQVTAG